MNNEERKVIELALEALEGFIPYLPLKDEAQCNRYDKAITAMKELLAQPEQDQDEVDIRSLLYQRIHELETDEKREVFERLQRDNALQALHDENERLGLYKDVYGDAHLSAKDYPEEVRIKNAMDCMVRAQYWHCETYVKCMHGSPLKAMEELALARVLIRELGDRLAKLEKPWVGLTDDDIVHIGVATGLERVAVNMIEAKLKEKNT